MVSAGTNTMELGKSEAIEETLQKMLRMAAGRGAASTAGGEHRISPISTRKDSFIHFHIKEDV